MSAARGLPTILLIPQISLLHIQPTFQIFTLTCQEKESINTLSLLLPSSLSLTSLPMPCSSSSRSGEEDDGVDAYRNGGYHHVRVGDTFSGGHRSPRGSSGRGTSPLSGSLTTPNARFSWYVLMVDKPKVMASNCTMIPNPTSLAKVIGFSIAGRVSAMAALWYELWCELDGEHQNRKSLLSINKEQLDEGMTYGTFERGLKASYRSKRRGKGSEFHRLRQTKRQSVDPGLD